MSKEYTTSSDTATATGNYTSSVIIKSLDKQFPDLEPDFIECDCHHEIVVVSSDQDFNDEPDVFLSIYELGSHRNHALSFWHRIRYAWRILTTGRPYVDQIVLRTDSATKLALSLLKHGRNRPAIVSE